MEEVQARLRSPVHLLQDLWQRQYNKGTNNCGSSPSNSSLYLKHREIFRFKRKTPNTATLIANCKTVWIRERRQITENCIQSAITPKMIWQRRGRNRDLQQGVKIVLDHEVRTGAKGRATEGRGETRPPGTAARRGAAAAGAEEAKERLLPRRDLRDEALHRSDGELHRCWASRGLHIAVPLLHYLSPSAAHYPVEGRNEKSRFDSKER